MASRVKWTVWFGTAKIYCVMNFLHWKYIIHFPHWNFQHCNLQKWYSFPFATAPSAHFKSTDGHKNTYQLSLKRMNLQFLTTATSASRDNGATLIVDASKSKVFPDSFSRTLPIWCAVLNRLVLTYRREGDSHSSSSFDWDSGLYTPHSISQEEHDVMMSLLPDRVNSALESGVIIIAKNECTRCVFCHRSWRVLEAKNMRKRK